uniref:acetylglutamate kinase n=1 Tax=Hypnea pseudomusciformis TaxID=1545697 RepID=UPI0027DA073E|nr:acetylglutamate kinase [Hypnea pseudomusciformis]WCH55203.1 acetylglutamate kinase [Hypnea pseudomusciformis]
MSIFILGFFMLNSTQFIQDLISISSLIRQYVGQVIVVKYGGSAMQDESLKKSVIDDILFLHSIGIKVVVVHGGGPIINHWLSKCNIKPCFRNGVRVTDYKTMQIVQMVLEGKVNKNLVSMLNLSGNYAIGLSGRDVNLINAIPLSANDDDFVGTVNNVNSKILSSLLDDGYIPVIASIASDSKGRVYNINADIVAGALAKALKVEKLIFLTDTPGIMLDITDDSTLIKTLSVSDVLSLKCNHIISAGMIPKVDCCIDVLRSNVQSVHIINGCLPHALLLEILTIDRIGSMLTL